MNEAQEKATREYEAASRAVNQQLVGKPGNRAEGEYGDAYQRLVVAGLAPQIKAKYRIKKTFKS